MIVFTPTEDFWSEGYRSQYCKGLTYRVRPGNDALAEAVKEWERQGKVKVVHVEAVPAGDGVGQAREAPEPQPSLWERLKAWL